MHPSPDKLADYLLGKLPEDQADEIIAHLEDCPACDDTMQSLQPTPDTVIEKLQGAPPADPITEESSCRDMVRRICDIGANASGGEPASDTASNTIDLEASGVVREYRLIEKLGQGGMGAVYKALHTKLDKTVAIKLLPAHRMEDAVNVARFEREMKAVGKLEHPHIVGARDAGEANGTHYLVMELVEGEDLAGLSKRFGALPVAEACELIRQAALGLQHAHERGMVHRDIKPSNLMLAKGPPAKVKILDMGLALLEDGPAKDGRELTSTGQLMGTIDYMAPEQGASTHDVDVRADIYSLGATLYRLLAGRAPFGGPGFETVMKKLTALAGEEPQSLRELRTDIPEELATIVHRMLAKNPNDRPASAEEVARLLEPFAASADLATLFGDTPGAVKEPRPPGSGLPTAKQPAHPLPGGRGSSNARRHWVVAGGVLGLVTLLGVAIFQFTTRDGTVIVQLDSERDIESIEVDGKSVTWSLAGDDRSYRFDVKPGPISSVVLTTADRVTIQAEIPAEGLTIKAGQPYQLTATVEPNPVAELSVAERQQAVIDWVRSLSGTIGGGNPEIGYVVVPPGEPVPDGRFDLVTVGLDQQPITDADLKRFDDLPFFTTLILTGTPITDQGLANLGDLPELLGVFLNETAITDAGLKELIRYRRIETLHISGTQITDASLDVLAKLPDLVSLQLVGTRVSRSGIERLHESLPLCRIESNFGVQEPRTPLPAPSDDPQRAVAEWVHAMGGEVGIGNAKTGYVTLSAGDPLPDGRIELVTISLAGAHITDADLSRFDKLPFLTTLALTEMEIGDAGLAKLGELASLYSLFLSDTRVGDAGLEHLMRYPQLHNLHLTRTDVTDAGLVHARVWQDLQELWIGECSVTDACIEHLATLKNLRRLVIERTGFSREGVDRLHAALPQCRIDSDFGTLDPVSSLDRPVAEWVHSRGGVVGLSGAAFNYVNVGPDDDLPEGDIQLVTIDLADRPISDTDLARLDRLAHLTTLILNETPTTDDGIARLGEFPNLVNIYLGGTHLTDIGLRLLAERYPKIRTLHAGETNITDAGIPTLLEWEDLLEIHLEVPAVTDASIEILESVRYLRRVSLAASGVTKEGVNRLHEAKPWCEIVSDFGIIAEPPIEGAASLRFNGINNHVDIPTLRYDATHPITIEASVRREPPYHEYAELISNGMTTDGPPCAVLNWNRESGWMFSILTDQPRSASRPEPNPAPRRIAGVWDGERLSVYFDGKLVSRNACKTTPNDERESGYFVIGAEQNLNGIDRYFHFLGVIDEVRISRIARYEDDYTPVTRFETDQHTMALYHFDEGEGDVLHDDSGNGHVGHIVGATWITRE